VTEENDPKVEVLAELRAASTEFVQGRDEQEKRRLRLARAIEQALVADIGPVAIEREVPYDRQHIDRIRRAAGIPAKRGATVRSIKD
jgi:nucleoid-associated protein YgaU